MRIAIGVLALGAVLAGCQRSSVPPLSQAPDPAVVTPSPRGLPVKTDMTLAERSTRYTQEHPWGDDTGTARLKGTVTWAEGNEPPAPVYRRALLLRGLKGAANEGRRYTLRTNAQGEYVFDRILGGEYELTDGLSKGSHWRLRVQINDGDDMTLDLTPGNGTQVHDDFPEESRQG